MNTTITEMEGKLVILPEEVAWVMEHGRKLDDGRLTREEAVRLIAGRKTYDWAMRGVHRASGDE